MSIDPRILGVAQALLGKLTEKSSLAGYLALFAAIGFKQVAGNADSIAAVISATAGALLFVLKDSQIAALFTASATSSVPITIPAADAAPTESNVMSLLDSLKTFEADLQKAAPVIEAIIPVVDAIAPSVGSKVAAIETIAKAVLGTGIVSDVEAVWGILSPLVAKQAASSPSAG